MIAIIIVFVLINIPNSVCAQTQQNGFFIGGSLTGLLMDGKGEGNTLSGGSDDFETTNDLLTITEGFNSVSAQMDGWSWKNKLLYGFKPYIGYRFSPKFAILGSYSSYRNKKGEYSTFLSASRSNFPLGYRFLEVETDAVFNANTEYTQNTIHILGIGKVRV